MFHFLQQTSSFVLLVVLFMSTLCGCGTTKQRKATEQLLLSDAVDRTISQIDFSALSEKKVFFDMQYIAHIKAAGFVNAPYIISSLRQQMISQRCHLVNKRDDAEYIVEARVGALGADAHDVTYGVPANNSLNAASSLMPTLPPLPTIPELSIAKRSDQFAAAKIGVFAYNRTTLDPVWKSGITQSKSTAKDTWIFGMGPFQRGTIYGGTQFAGSSINVLPFEKSDESKADEFNDFAQETHFKYEPKLKKLPSATITPSTKTESKVVQANHEVPASKKEVPGSGNKEVPESGKVSSGKIATGNPASGNPASGNPASGNIATDQKKPVVDKKTTTPLQKVEKPPKLLTPPSTQSAETEKEKKPSLQSVTKNAKPIG